MEPPLVKRPLLDPVDIDSSVLLLFIFPGAGERERETDRQREKPFMPFRTIYKTMCFTKDPQYIPLQDVVSQGALPLVTGTLAVRMLRRYRVVQPTRGQAE